MYSQYFRVLDDVYDPLRDHVSTYLNKNPSNAWTKCDNNLIIAENTTSNDAICNIITDSSDKMTCQCSAQSSDIGEYSENRILNHSID